MTTEIEVAAQPLSALDVRAQVNLIQEVMSAVMKDGTHYGLIPGAGTKPTLLKAGAEKLASTFRLAVDPVVEELSYGDEFRVRVKANITEMGTGRFLGAGVGECSSSESKYQWRAVVCDEEFEASPDSQRRLKWNRGKTGPWSQKQVRMNVADVANTVLKMAKKRAMVDGILTVTGASDIFTQDVEELPKEYLEQKVSPASVAPNPSVSRENSTSSPTATETSPATSTTSATLHSSGTPDIRPRSQKGTQPPPQAAEKLVDASPFREEAPQGEVVNAEPSITEKQRRMFFAISKSADLNDDQVKAALAKVGIHCHRDAIPKSMFQKALDAIDPAGKFHTLGGK